MSKPDMIDSAPERIRPDGVKERVIAFANKRRARVVPSVVGMTDDGDHVYVYAVQLLDCRNDEHENRLFPRRDALTKAGASKALGVIAKLPAPNQNKYDR